MHFITKDSVVIYKNDKKQIDMAFPQLGTSVKSEAILDILDNVCFYLFQGTNICPENDPLIRNRVVVHYPRNYKDIVGTAYWDEEEYADNLARVRLYRKVRKMIRTFVRELKVYFEAKKKGVDEAYRKNVNSFTASKKARSCRDGLFKFINYEVDEKSKNVRAYFGKDIRGSRQKFMMMATEISNVGMLNSVRSFYDVDIFIREEFIPRGYVGVAKYNVAEEDEPFSVGKGKELAKADLIRRYMRFEELIAKDNYEAFCKDMNIVLERIDRILAEAKY